VSWKNVFSKLPVSDSSWGELFVLPLPRFLAVGLNAVEWLERLQKAAVKARFRGLSGMTAVGTKAEVAGLFFRCGRLGIVVHFGSECRTLVVREEIAGFASGRKQPEKRVKIFELGLGRELTGQAF
jgi:hypothetical protein